MRGGGCVARGQENEAAHCKNNRGRWMRRNKRWHDNQPGQTREVNWRRTHRLAVGRLEAEEEGYFYHAVECVFDQICSFGLNVIRYVMFLCFRVQFRTKQMKCLFAYVMLNIICLYVFMFWGMLHCWRERYVFMFLCFLKTSLWTRPQTSLPGLTYLSTLHLNF
jgi:hypothetical protein